MYMWGSVSSSVQRIQLQFEEEGDHVIGMSDNQVGISDCADSK